MTATYSANVANRPRSHAEEAHGTANVGSHPFVNDILRLPKVLAIDGQTHVGADGTEAQR